MAASLAELNHRFAIPGIAQVSAGNGGLAKVTVTAPSAAGEMYLHGAHVTSWHPTGAEEVIFVSAHSLWDESHAIRGGVPICFPWFGDKADDPQAPAHGFVRTKSWELESIAQSGDAVMVTMATVSDDASRKWWPHEFRLEHRVTFGAELLLELMLTNTGSSGLRFEEALHAYHRVGDAEHARVSGLDGTRYLDKTDGYREKAQRGDVIIVGETDRVYLDTERELGLIDPVLQRRITVAKQHSRTTVVWNPWAAKARAMTDLGEDQWRQMLCIETSNVGELAVEVAPGGQQVMKATVSVKELQSPPA